MVTPIERQQNDALAEVTRLQLAKLRLIAEAVQAESDAYREGCTITDVMDARIAAHDLWRDEHERTA